MRTSFNIPDEVVAEFDRVWQDEDLENCSQAVREAMLEYIEAHSRLEDTSGEIVALVGFDYRYHDVIQELHAVQHDYQDVIIATCSAEQTVVSTTYSFHSDSCRDLPGRTDPGVGAIWTESTIITIIPSASL